MSKVSIQNKSPRETIQLLNLDGVNVFATLAPGQFVEINAKDGKMITPFIVKEVKPEQV